MFFYASERRVSNDEVGGAVGSTRADTNLEGTKTIDVCNEIRQALKGLVER